MVKLLIMLLLKRKNVFYDLIVLSLGNKSSLYDKIIGERSINKNYNEIAITAFGKHNSKVKDASQFFLKEGPFVRPPVLAIFSHSSAVSIFKFSSRCT